MTPQPEALKTIPFNWSIIRYRPWLFAAHCACVVAAFGMQVFPGLIEKAIFDSITGAAPATLGLWTLIVLLFVTELVRLMSVWGLILTNVPFFVHSMTLLRKNLLRYILKRRGVFTSVVERAPADADALDADDRREISILIEAIADDIEHYPFGPE